MVPINMHDMKTTLPHFSIPAQDEIMDGSSMLRTEMDSGRCQRPGDG